MSTNSNWKYPDVRRDNTEDDFFGTKVKDPYRWLEDPDSPETQEFVSKQNEITEPFINSLPIVDTFHNKLKQVINFPKYNPPFKKGNNWFFWKNSGLQNHESLHIQKTPQDDDEVFLDPNTLSEDGTVAVSGTTFSESGKFCCYRASVAGSDWNTAYVINVDTRETLTDKVEWIKYGGVTWTHDDKGFYYNRYPIPKGLQDDKGQAQSDILKKGKETDSAKNQQVFYHVLGTPQSEDKLVYDMPEEPTFIIGITVTDDGRYLLLDIMDGCERVCKFYYVDLQNIKYDKDGKYEPVKAINNFEAWYGYITNDGTTFYFLHSSKKISRSKIIKLDITKPTEIIEIVPEHEKDVITSVSCINDHFVVTTMHDVKDILQIYSMDGKFIKTLDVPIGGISSIHADRKEKEFYFYFVSFLSPGTIYHYDFISDKLSVYKEITIPGYDTSNLETVQVFYPSKDGTKIPMFIIKKKDAVLDGENTTILYGYGGFNISIGVYFSTSRLLFIHHFNGIYCIANIRGGNEYGEEWHQAAKLDKKQNCFDDFQYAAKYLVEKKYTSPKKLAINGGSNGGLLVCATFLQAPELFAVGISQVAVTDMLRFHKFTIGHAWVSEYGSSDNKDDFEFLIKYSPLHTVKRKEGVNYPALVLLTADHDDRVVPAHSYKLISELQHQLGHASCQTNPFLIRIEVKAGHGAGKPLVKTLREIAEYMSIIAHVTDTKVTGL